MTISHGVLSQMFTTLCKLDLTQMSLVETPGFKIDVMNAADCPVNIQFTESISLVSAGVVNLGAQTLQFASQGTGQFMSFKQYALPQKQMYFRFVKVCLS